jgi:hypothetical protein
MREYFENLSSNKLENLKEMDEFLDAFDVLKLNQRYRSLKENYNKQ